jgi:ATP-dependent helicase/nuclease subunit A
MTTPDTGASDADGDDEFELTEEQQTALELDHNIAITAGAGTGKTTTLTERYLQILTDTDAGPEEIVTITFTNDAANEMQERIRDVVGEQLTTAGPAAYSEWRTIKDELEDGYVHTIHGFCSRILREHIVDAPVRPEFEVYDGTDAKTLTQDVVRDVLDEKLAAGDSDIDMLGRLWNRSTLEDVLTGLLAKRPTSHEWVARWRDANVDDYMDFVWTEIHPISPDFAEAVFTDQALRDSFETFRELRAAGVVDDVDPEDDRGSAKVRDVSQLLDEYNPLSPTTTVRAQQQFLDAVCDLLTTDDGTRHGHDWWYWGSGNRWEGAGRQSDQDRLEEAIETFFDVADPESLDFGVERDTTSAHYVLALARTFDDVLDAYDEEKQQQNVLDYDDLVETTIDFLEDNPSVREQLQAQFEYVMVDEIQDTDPRQWTLVKLLTSGDPENYDAQNVFLVGDEKQSIYRFRGADVTTFAHARSELETADTSDVETNLELSGSFRTTNGALDFINDVFRDVFEPLSGTTREPYEAAPQELTPERDKGMDVEAECEYLLIPDDDDSVCHGDGYLDATPRFVQSGEREAYAVATRLTRLFDDPPRIYDETAERYRDATPADVSILLRSRTCLKAYERALDEFDVPYAVVSGTGFYDSTEVTAILNLLRVLENPSDERSLYGVLRSPLFGITDEDLATLFFDADEAWHAACNANGNIGKAAGCIQRWRKLAGTHPDVSAESATPWGTLLSRVIDETGYLASLAGDERPRQAAVNVNRLREQLRTWEEAGVKTAAEVIARLEQRRDIESHADEATIPEDTDGVEIRTIHSAKGLEFPIVVVPELGTKFNFQANVDDDGKVYLDEFDLSGTDGEEPVLGIKSPAHDEPFLKSDTLVRRVTKARMQRHERAELKRLLYVAMTRARDHVLLSGVHEIEEEEEGMALAEPNDPDEAMCWRDWVQPILLDGVSLWTISKSGVWEGTLAESTYRVTQPEAPATEWQRDESGEAPSLSLEIPEIRVQERQTVVTASDYADLVAGDSQHDAEENEDEWEDVEDLHPGTLGTIVHRIAERQPDRDQWESFARGVADREQEVIAEKDLDRILTGAERCLSFVDAYEAQLTSPRSYDELSVAARFDDLRVVGDIDRLVVTDDAFHIIDYKTNDVDAEGVDALADYYWPQLQAYATALHQSDQGRDIHLTLYFSNCDAARTQTHTVSELDLIESSVHENVRDNMQ